MEYFGFVRTVTSFGEWWHSRSLCAGVKGSPLSPLFVYWSLLWVLGFLCVCVCVNKLQCRKLYFLNFWLLLEKLYFLKYVQPQKAVDNYLRFLIKSNGKCYSELSVCPSWGRKPKQSGLHTCKVKSSSLLCCESLLASVEIVTGVAPGVVCLSGILQSKNEYSCWS